MNSYQCGLPAGHVLNILFVVVLSALITNTQCHYDRLTLKSFLAPSSSSSKAFTFPLSCCMVKEVVNQWE